MSSNAEPANVLIAGETISKPSSETHKNAPQNSQDIVAIPAASVPTATTGISAETASGIKQTNLVIHHLNNSRSQRLLWLLEELEVPYSIEKYHRNEEFRAPGKLKDVHLLGKAPVLTDGDVTIAESGAIVEYVISKYGEKFRPTEPGKMDDLYFSHYAEGSLMPILVNKYIFSLIPQRSPAFIRPFLKPVFATLVKKLVDPELKGHCALIESYLEKSETGWLAGCDHPTSADFMMMYPAEALATRSQFVGPRTKEYVELIHQRPAYKRALEKGGEYSFAKF